MDSIVKNNKPYYSVFLIPVILFGSCGLFHPSIEDKRPVLIDNYVATLPNGLVWSIRFYDDMTFEENNYTGSWQGEYFITKENKNNRTLVKLWRCANVHYGRCVVCRTDFAQSPLGHNPIVRMFDFAGKQLTLHYLCFKDENGNILYKYDIEQDTGKVNTAIPKGTKFISAYASKHSISTYANCTYEGNNDVNFMLVPHYTYPLEFSENGDTIYYQPPDTTLEWNYSDAIKLVRQNSSKGTHKGVFSHCDVP